MTSDNESLEARLAAAPLVGRGAEAEIYAWGDGRVLRLFSSESSARRYPAVEAAVMRAVAAAGVPVPAVDEPARIGDRAGLVMERVDGGGMLESLKRAPWRAGAVARRFGELHASIHASPAPPDLPTVHDSVAASIANLDPEDQWLRDWAEHELGELPAGTALHHGDFHPENVLVGSDGPRVIDWTGAKIGPPEADVARTLVLLEGSMPPHAGWVERLLIGLLRNRTFLPGYRVGYLRHAPLDMRSVRRWRMVRIIERLVEGPDSEQPALRALIRESGGPADFAG